MAAQQSKQGRLPLPRWKWVHMRPSLPADDLEDLHFNHLLCFQCLNSHDLFRDTVQSILPVLLVIQSILPVLLVIQSGTRHPE